MKTKKSGVLALIFSLALLPQSIASTEEAPNYAPQIFSNGTVYHTQFQHTDHRLKYHISAQNVMIDGEMKAASVVRFAPNILNAGAPTQSAEGSRQGWNLYNFNVTVNLTGLANSQIIVVEIFDHDIDLNNQMTLGDPKGKGTLVSNKPPEGGSN